MFSYEDGGLVSIQGQQAHPQGGEVVAREVLTLERVARKRGTWQVYLQGIVLEVVKGKLWRDFKGGLLTGFTTIFSNQIEILFR